MKTILFFDLYVNERGMSASTYDYALYNETILGNKSIFCSLTKPYRFFSNNRSLQKIKNRFQIILIDKFEDIHKVIQDNNIDFFYIQKDGYKDEFIVNEIPSLIHSVFCYNEPHGAVYAYISKWLVNHNAKELPYVPYMVNLPKTTTNLKTILNISSDKFVYGWYGGNTFDIEFAKNAVIEVAKQRNDVIFLFMGCDKFCDLPNVIFLPFSVDLEYKVNFINTCDMMIHARKRGETFGLAIAEFSSNNKPIITYLNSKEQNHIDILGDKGFYYSSYEELYNLLINNYNLNDKDWNCYKEFTPENVMKKFNDVFLK